jgi:hypothetical protein
MRTTLLLPILYCICNGLMAQTYFYISSLQISPPEPTTQDPITLYIEGSLSSTGSYISSVEVEVEGPVVHVHIHAGSGPGLDILVPHTEEVDLGQLQAGTYLIHIMGDFVLDGAPDPEHSFTVSASGGGVACDSLQITSVQFHAFSDTLLVVQLINTSSEIFSLPAFILLDAAGDTIAVEQPDSFGIGPASTHYLSIWEDADLSLSQFTGTLELWTGFFNTLACTFPVQMDLCPPPGCATVIPFIYNLGGAIVNTTFDYVIYGPAGFEIEGTIVLDDEHQISGDTICLPHGNYSMYVQTSNFSGQPWIGITNLEGQMGPTIPVTAFQAPILFSVYQQCEEIIEDVPEATDHGLMILQRPEELLVMDQEAALISIQMYDARGVVVRSAGTRADAGRISLTGLSSGVYLVHVQRSQGIPVIRRIYLER